ncbi:MAG: helix-turn-helix transcriptional regulator [Rhodospirillaceae bacterium]|jgi:transcriptional regulator with XRE-family HTH domain|nr:helix-turn-helix transcriptional regulator [Rhodospirillaceae bacterium]
MPQAADTPPVSNRENFSSAGLGAQIRDLRKAKRITLQSLAETIGRSVGYVSQLERGLSSVDIETLHAISDALGVGINWFFEEGEAAPSDERDIIVRRDKRRRLHFTGSGLDEELLSPNLSGPFEMIITTYPPGVASGVSAYSRPTDQAGLVLAGELILEHEQKSYELKAGDSFQFSGWDAHRSYNPGTIETKVLWVISPPTY